MILDYVRTSVCVTCYFTTYEGWYVVGDTNIRKYEYKCSLATYDDLNLCPRISCD